MSDKIEGTLYQKATEHMRHAKFLQRDQAIQGLGLQKVDKTVIGPGKASTAIARIFDKVDFWVNEKNPENNHYYTFGWSGLVSMSMRYQDARRFYTELTQEIEKFRAQGIEPKVRIYV